ncbi:RDD family protein [Georgenia satyanarayanai]|uniref:RDD family protein n=1 Tax=Georgenia satyanarayanai TaxID=860221 RepID=UPI001D0116E7|nr:RDD family protein [Georgenia satyanarayanai]
MRQEQSGTAGSTAPAPLGRRIIALAVDWGVATAISAGFLDNNALATLGIFAVMTILLLATRGATIGHTLLGLRVRAVDGGAARPLQVLIRTASLCLVIPAVVWGLDGRGLHDVWAGTRIVRG